MEQNCQGENSDNSINREHKRALEVKLSSWNFLLQLSQEPYTEKQTTAVHAVI